ncbi:MAG: hypothetical protein ACXADD_17375 [Candidatus Thorarchaeota archaeon]|jgi:hypothetical protein
MSGWEEYFDNIKNNALSGDELEKRRAIEQIRNKKLIQDRKWQAILVLAEIGKASRWPEPKNLALEAIIELIGEAHLER